tara:strand:- start:1758 stop:2243 length:486 start_codon:yes stop_codon:yes gene_type:complete
MNTIKTNSVVNTIKTTKKVVARKPLTLAQKEAQAKKRALNPQFANVQSARRRTEKDAFKTDAILCLLEVKRTAKLENVSTDSYENIAYQSECKKAINFLTADKNKAKFLPLLTNAVRTYKGAFVVYYFEQLIQKITKMQIDKGLDFATSLEAIASAKLVNA